MFKKNKKIKIEIIEYAKDGLKKYLNLSEEEACKLIKENDIEKYIDIAPDIWEHMNQEQLVYEIIR